MLFIMNHEERIGKFIQYLLENGFDEAQLRFDTDVPSINYLVAANTKRGDFFWRAFEFLPSGDIVENFSDGSSDFIDDIYPVTQSTHTHYQKVVERLRLLNDNVDEVEFNKLPDYK